MPMKCIYPTIEVYFSTERDGNRQNARRIVGKKSKKSRSDDAISRKISGGAKNIKDSGRGEKRKDGLSRGDGDVEG